MSTKVSNTLEVWHKKKATFSRVSSLNDDQEKNLSQRDKTEHKVY